MSRVPIPQGDKDFKYKEQLYALFYELTSEVKGKDIELEEEEYINNIHSIKFSNLINYVRDIIHILINKQSNPISSNANNNTLLSSNQVELFEQIIQSHEANERRLLKKYYELIYIKEIQDICLSDYHQMELDYISLKDKVKYEEGRFLTNERKDNEIIIIRQENAILKKTIAELEEKNKNNEIDMNNLNKDIEKLLKCVKEYKNEIDKLKTVQKANINININNNNNNVINSNTIKKINNSLNQNKGNQSLDKSPGESSRLKLINMTLMQSKPKTKRIIHYNQSKLNKSMGLNSNSSILDMFSNKALSIHKASNPTPTPNPNHSMSMIMNMTQRESSIGQYRPLQSRKHQESIDKPFYMKISMMHADQSKTPMTNSHSLNSKRNQSVNRISLSKGPSYPLTNKFNSKVSLNSSKG